MEESSENNRDKAFLVTWLDKKETRREEKEGRAGSYNACDVVV